MSQKYKCGICEEKMAVWIYMPGYGDKSSPYSCDDCIISPDDKIGCSCNWRRITDGEYPEGVEGVDWRRLEHDGDDYMSVITKEEGYWIYLDEKGRPSPCVEYEYDSEGFDIPTIFERISWWFKLKWINLKHSL